MQAAAALAKLSALTNLDLDRNKIGDISAVRALGAAPALQDLQLTSVTPGSAGALAKMTGLTRLCLARQVKGRSVDPVVCLRNLTHQVLSVAWKEDDDEDGYTCRACVLVVLQQASSWVCWKSRL